MPVVNMRKLVCLTTTHLIDAEDSEVDSGGLTLVEEFQEQVVQIARVVVGEQADDDIDIPGKFALHSENTQQISQRVNTTA